MTVSIAIWVVLVCKMVSARFIGIPNYDIPRNWGIRFHQLHPDQRVHISPRFSGYVPFVHANPGSLNQHGPHTASRPVTHLQQTIVLTNNIHIQNSSALNSTGSGNQHVPIQNKVDLANNRSGTQTNTQHSSQVWQAQYKPLAGAKINFTPDIASRQNPVVSQRNANQIHISFQEPRNNPASSMLDIIQASPQGGNSPGRILVKSMGTINIAHPRGAIEISRSHNGRSNIIIKTNTQNKTPQREIRTELTTNVPTTEILDVVTSAHASVTEEIEHEVP